MRANLLDKIIKFIFCLISCISIISITLICYFIFSGGIRAIGKIGYTNFLLGQEWSPTNIPPSFGILPMIIGSIYISIGSQP